MQNKFNLELKYFCSDFEPIRRVLKEIGAKKVGTSSQKDYFFNLPISKDKIKPRLKLRIERDKQTLIFYKRPDFTQGKSTPSDVTLFPVKDSKLLQLLKKFLGTKAVVIKKRELWKKNNTVFNLDQVKGVGKIFEIELTAKDQIEQEEKELDFYRAKLLPYLEQIVTGSNVDLVLNKKTLDNH